jgi:cbb3-type cytochrome oxidase maturation protein
MTAMLVLIPIALIMGLVGLVAFLWAVKTNQYDDLEGHGARILIKDYDDLPVP